MSVEARHHAIIAIVIPAYNAGKTLRRAVGSVLAQTLSDLQVWVVDDGSKDDTYAVACQLVKEDSRVHALHQENLGAYRARLLALKEVDSDWVGFVDADDEVSPKLYERAVSFGAEHDLDIVQFDEYESNGSGIELFETRGEVLNKVIAPRLIRGDNALLVWDKIYRSRLVHVDFWDCTGVTAFDDHIMNLYLFLNANSVGYIHERLYNYTPVVGTASKSYSPVNLLGLCTAIDARGAVLSRYGLPSVEAMDLIWRRKNVRGVFLRACFAPNCTFRQACRNARCILENEKLRKVLGCFVHVPAWLSVLVVRCGYWLRRGAKKCLSLKA